MPTTQNHGGNPDRYAQNCQRTTQFVSEQGHQSRAEDVNMTHDPSKRQSISFKTGKHAKVTVIRRVAAHSFPFVRSSV